MQQETIPNVVHCIWAGGTTPLPPEGIIIITEWASNHPNGKIYLWVDPQTSGKSYEELLQQYKEIFNTRGISVVGSTSEAESKSNFAPIIVKDIRMEGLRSEHVDYELDKLEPNYGGSSDLIRYGALEEGGIYIDCTDVHPNFPIEKTNLLGSSNSHILVVDDLTQNATPDPSQLAIFNTKTIGNDTFIATRRNPLIKAIREEAEKNYNLRLQEESKIIQYAHASHHPKIITISRTGPGLVQTVIGKDAEETLSSTRDPFTLVKTCISGDVLIKKARNTAIQLTNPSSRNTRLWLKANDHLPPISLEEARRKVFKAIDFEVQRFHYLRLEYHAETLARALKNSGTPVTTEQAFYMITSELQRKDNNFWAQVKYVPITGGCPAVLTFCESKRLETLFSFADKTKQIILSIETNKIDTETLMIDLRPALELKKDSVDYQEKLRSMFRNIDKDILVEGGKKIAHGLRFINFVTQHPEMFPSPGERVQFLQSANEIMQQYMRLNTLLKTVYPDEPIFRQNHETFRNVLSTISTFKNYGGQQPQTQETLHKQV